MEHEGRIPAPPASHALAEGDKWATTIRPATHIIVSLSGRGDKDVEQVARGLSEQGWGQAIGWTLPPLTFQ